MLTSAPVRAFYSGAWRNHTSSLVQSAVPSYSGTGTFGYTVTTPSAVSFSHPGVMYTSDQLTFVKAKLDANQQPWTQAYTNMMNAKGSTSVPYSSTSWTPTPQAVVSRGSSGSNSNGDIALQDDLHAALCHALIWNYKGTRANAVKAVEILNAWSQTLTEIKYDTTSQYSDGKLLSGWTGTVIARAAELMRYTYTPAADETALDVKNLERVFNDVWWPKISVGHGGPGFNWYCSFADSMVQIAVFLDDQTKFDFALRYMRGIIGGLIYMPGDNNPFAWGHPAGNQITYSDGTVLQLPSGTPLPCRSVPDADGGAYKASGNAVTFMENLPQNGGWGKPLSMPTGLWGETGRDFHHTGMGFAAVSNFAETARHQGVNYFAEQQARLTAGVELFTGFVWSTFVGGTTSPPNWPFAKSSSANSFATSTQRATFETFYAHYVQRLGLAMPNLTKYMNDYARNSSYDVDLHACWETLTLYGTP